MLFRGKGKEASIVVRLGVTEWLPAVSRGFAAVNLTKKFGNFSPFKDMGGPEVLRFF